MTQQQKDKLLKYLCMALPYGVKIQYDIHGIQDLTIDKLNAYIKGIKNIKPYLRPMSSMTEEERKEYHKLCNIDEEYGVGGNPVIIAIHDTPESLDYLNSIHIDYRGLIDESNAIEVTEKNNPYKD